MQSTMTEPNETPKWQASGKWRQFSHRKVTEGDDRATASCNQSEDAAPTPPTPRQTLMDEAIRDDLNILQRRPEQISLAVHRESTSVSLGLLFCEMTVGAAHDDGTTNGDEEKPPPVLLVQEIQAQSLCAVSNPNVEQDATLLQPGDVLETINQESFSTLENVESFLESLVGDVVITVSTTPVQANKQDSSDGLCQLVICKPNTMDVKETSTSSSLLEFCQNPQGLLQIKSVPTNGLFSGINNVISTGDVVLAIGNNICISVDARDAQCFLDCKLETSDIVSVLTQQQQSPIHQTGWNSVRKSVVAVGGGTMTAVGAVMMVTPLHPIGHALAIGGVTVLGTEFEAPQKALKSARGFATNAVSRRKRLSQLDQVMTTAEETSGGGDDDKRDAE